MLLLSNSRVEESGIGSLVFPVPDSRFAPDHGGFEQHSRTQGTEGEETESAGENRRLRRRMARPRKNALVSAGTVRGRSVGRLGTPFSGDSRLDTRLGVSDPLAVRERTPPAETPGFVGIALPEVGVEEVPPPEAEGLDLAFGDEFDDGESDPGYSRVREPGRKELRRGMDIARGHGGAAHRSRRPRSLPAAGDFRVHRR